MPYIEENLRHDRFLDDLFDKVFRRFKDKSDNYWWPDFNDKTAKVDLYKITFERGLFVKGGEGYMTPDIPQKGHLCITRHVIMRRWDNQLLGFAQSTGAVKVITDNIPSGKTEMMKWLTNFYKEFVNYTTVYSYTMDSYEGYTHYEKDGMAAPVTIMMDDSGAGVLKASLDVEFYNEDEYYNDMHQSPVITMKLKGDSGEAVQAIGKLNYQSNTNWWGDSLVQLKGVFDETSAFFTLKVDSAPEWANNMVTLVPFFFGNLIQKNATKRNETPTAILGGTQVGKFFDFDNIELHNEILQPVTRNYVHHPSNGVDSIMIKKTKYGARYQEHFLRWSVPPNLMPPTREEIRLVKQVEYDAGLAGKEKPREVGVQPAYPIESTDPIDPAPGVDEDKLIEVALKYPRAWNYLRNGYYQYDFHASRYSDKIHTSRASVIHPEDGVVGYIPNIVLLPVINIMEGDRLKFPLWCAECTEPDYNPEVPTIATGAGWNPDVPPAPATEA